MSSLAFLLDQHISPAISASLLADEPSIVMKLVGDADAPPLGTKDPELSEFAHRHSLSIVTFDIRTMPAHIADRLRSGQHTAGVFIFPNDRLSPGRIADELLLVWMPQVRKNGLIRSVICHCDEISRVS